MKTPALRSRYKKNADLIDMDYLEKLPPDDLAFMEAFVSSFYNGSPSLRPGSVPPAESYRLNDERRRDLFAVFVPVQVDEEIDDFPPYRSPMAESRKRRRRRTKGAA